MFLEIIIPTGKLQNLEMKIEYNMQTFRDELILTKAGLSTVSMLCCMPRKHPLQCNTVGLYG